MPHSVVELRQYRIVPGKRDEFIALFEGKFIESQEELGIKLVGQFRDIDDSDRFVWLRAFDNMGARQRLLTAFYSGPVWQANRNAANPMLDDNDNVLLLRPAAPGLAFVEGSRNSAPARDLVFASIEYLWKSPDEGFTQFFELRLMPALRAAGLDVIAGYVPEEAENNFPRLPIRREKLFVWFARGSTKNAVDHALQRLGRNAQGRRLLAELREFEERDPQQLRWRATPRSALR